MSKDFVLAILSFITFSGITVSCDNSLDPIDEETGIYAIYGSLDVREETNYIRIRNLNAPFTLEATREIDATVTLSNLTAGTSMVLESSAREHEGIFLHNFIVPGGVIPDNEYHLLVERSDGAEVDAFTITTTYPEPLITPTNQNCYDPMDIEFGPLNGGAIVLRVALSLGQFGVIGPPQNLRQGINQPDDKVIYSLTLNEELPLFVNSFNSGNHCSRAIFNDMIYIIYTHYAPGFYEKLFDEEFDIIDSTIRFGSHYRDTLIVPVDITKICPPHCD